jgi:hypothetical protein
MTPSARLLYASLLYALCMVALFVAQPSWAFVNGTPRPFGIGGGEGGKTPFAPTTCSTVFAVASFQLVCFVDLVLRFGRRI